MRDCEVLRQCLYSIYVHVTCMYVTLLGIYIQIHISIQNQVYMQHITSAVLFFRDIAAFCKYIFRKMSTVVGKNAKKNKARRKKKSAAAANSNNNVDDIDMQEEEHEENGDGDDDDNGTEIIAQHQEKKKKKLNEAKEWLSSLTETDIFNPTIFTESSLQQYRTSFHSHQPYKLLYIHNFMDSDYLVRIKDELMKLDYYHKSNDLYEFAQR